MADIRAGIGIVPLGFLIADGYRTDSITLAFTLSPEWDTECYLCDSYTGDRLLIANDTHIRIATPADHELRYYIQGTDTPPDTPTDWQPATQPETAEETVYAFSQTAQQVTVVAPSDIAEITAFGIAGRQLHHTVLTDRTAGATPIYTMPLPSGVTLISVRLLSGCTTLLKVPVPE